MAWFYKGRKYWYHNGRRYSSPIRNRYSRTWVYSDLDTTLYVVNKDNKWYLEDTNRRRNFNERTLMNEITGDNAQNWIKRAGKLSRF